MHPLLNGFLNNLWSVFTLAGSEKIFTWTYETLGKNGIDKSLQTISIEFLVLMLLVFSHKETVILLGTDSFVDSRIALEVKYIMRFLQIVHLMRYLFVVECMLLFLYLV